MGLLLWLWLKKNDPDRGSPGSEEINKLLSENGHILASSIGGSAPASLVVDPNPTWSISANASSSHAANIRFRVDPTSNPSSNDLPKKLDNG